MAEKKPPNWGMLSFFLNVVRLVVALIHTHE